VPVCGLLDFQASFFGSSRRRYCIVLVGNRLFQIQQLIKMLVKWLAQFVKFLAKGVILRSPSSYFSSRPDNRG